MLTRLFFALVKALTLASEMSGFADLTWTFGLRNHLGLYLSAETFGFRVNCSGKLMRKKQIFVLEQVGGQTFIRT
jgi:hypothetical protein